MSSETYFRSGIEITLALPFYKSDITLTTLSREPEQGDIKIEPIGRMFYQDTFKTRNLSHLFDTELFKVEE